MDYEIIIQTISTVGFPIAACVALYYLATTTIGKVTDALADINQTLIVVNERLGRLEEGVDNAKR